MPTDQKPDRIEALDQAQDRAIAAAVRAQFGQGGDLSSALREVDRLSRERLQLHAQVTHLHA